MEQIRRIMRPTDVPDTGLLCDLLWSDPDKDVQGWGENDRGVSFTFGADVVTKFLHRHDLDLICRAHQVVEDGYEFFAKRQLVTLFSAPNYCGEFDNAGGMMSVDETLMCSFQVSFDLFFFRFSVFLVNLFHEWLHSQWVTFGQERLTKGILLYHEQSIESFNAFIYHWFVDIIAIINMAWLILPDLVCCDFA